MNIFLYASNNLEIKLYIDKYALYYMYSYWLYCPLQAPEHEIEHEKHNLMISINTAFTF